MAKVYAVHQGAAIRIGNFGVCSHLQEPSADGTTPGPWVETPIEVPDDVASELEAEIAGDPGESANVKKGTPGRPAREGRTDIRVVRVLSEVDASKRGSRRAAAEKE